MDAILVFGIIIAVYWLFGKMIVSMCRDLFKKKR